MGGDGGEGGRRRLSAKANEVEEETDGMGMRLRKLQVSAGLGLVVATAPSLTGPLAKTAVETGRELRQRATCHQVIFFKRTAEPHGTYPATAALGALSLDHYYDPNSWNCFSPKNTAERRLASYEVRLSALIFGYSFEALP